MAAAMSPSTRRPTVLLLTHARTASHVIQRMLSKQPDTIYSEDWFATIEARLARRAIIRAGPIEDIDPKIPQEFMIHLDGEYARFREFLDDAERQGKTAFVFAQPHIMLNPGLMSDYVHHRWDASTGGRPGFWTVGSASEAHTNITVLPDYILLRPGTIPIINFRHPFLVCDGLIRGFRELPAYREDPMIDKLLLLGGNLRWQRLMYDWYVEHGVPLGIEPMLLDADDFLGPEKESLMRRLCDRVPGFDIDSVIYSWSKTTPEELANMSEDKKQALKTLLASDGVMEGKDMRNRSLHSEMVNWVGKWGQDNADRLRRLVEQAMPDYEYLMERRLRPSGPSQ